MKQKLIEHDDQTIVAAASFRDDLIFGVSHIDQEQMLKQKLSAFIKAGWMMTALVAVTWSL